MDPLAWHLAAQRLRDRAVPTEPAALVRWLDEAGDLLAALPAAADHAEQEALAATFEAAMTMAHALGLLSVRRTFTGTAVQDHGVLHAVEYAIGRPVDGPDLEAAT